MGGLYHKNTYFFEVLGCNLGVSTLYIVSAKYECWGYYKT